MALFVRTFVLSVVGGLVLLGCGGGAVEPSAPALQVLADGDSPVVRASVPTPWPTFTPLPVPTALPVVAPVLATAQAEPTPVLYPTLVPAVLAPPAVRVPTAVPAPTLAVVVPTATSVSVETFQPVVVDVVVTLEAPTPTPTLDSDGFEDPPAGGILLYRDGAAFQRQSVFVMQQAELPDYLQEGDLSRLPPTSERIPHTAPFIFWFVGFDMSQAVSDFEMEVTLRWMSLGPEGVGLEGLEMYSDSRVLTHVEPYFYSGIGAPVGGVWPLGGYRLELLDDRGELIGSWGFFVI